ncbi:polypeptide N-acetylgalactosaminyltransferase 2 isoform X3 [Hydra vulgaris]|uniref:Polypeptide N-acetylgalactosaminyltransferase n=1 Tax=Hydra vulgaris TaxID=6087 RepID=A0ABM4CGD9_HYDVU
MKFRRNRICIALLFLVWIGGMLYFFVSNKYENEKGEISVEERNKHIDNAKLSREKDRIERDINIANIVKDPKFRDNEQIDQRSLAKFDWKGYQLRGALKPGEDKNQRNAYNQEASELLPWDRVVPDVRDPGCRKKSYDKNLPTTTIIICFHNEGRAALLRTVVSALNKSPEHLLKEIILVDDFSDNPLDGEELLALPRVKLIRNNQREGLIRSRVKGADMAVGEVLTFLDSHCECNEMWLEPLLQAIKDNRKIVASPIIDVIGHEDFKYLSSSSDLRGGFGWNLNFKWDFLPPNHLIKHQQDGTAFILSPVIAGGLFSIHKSWFEELGKYDPQMDVWGGENLEISFRTWQCGGEMYIIPCSRVGHVFRDRHPYKFPGGSMNVFQKNTRRAAEVWMDDYKKYYFAAVPSARYSLFGDIRDRLQLRKDLSCKSFKWYLENIYPELKIPDDDVTSYGQIKYKGREDCLNVVGEKSNVVLSVLPCRGSGGKDGDKQDWSWTKSNQIKHESLCLSGISKKSEEIVRMVPCVATDNFQKWKYDEKAAALVNLGSNLCLDNYNVGKELMQTECKGHDTQSWKLAFTSTG